MGIDAGRQFGKQRRRALIWKKDKSMLDQRAQEFGKYPNCIGLFEDCPKEIPDPKNPPSECRTCPELPKKYR